MIEVRTKCSPVLNLVTGWEASSSRVPPTIPHPSFDRASLESRGFRSYPLLGDSLRNIQSQIPQVVCSRSSGHFRGAVAFALFRFLSYLLSSFAITLGMIGISSSASALIGIAPNPHLGNPPFLTVQSTGMQFTRRNRGLTP